MSTRISAVPKRPCTGSLTTFSSGSGVIAEFLAKHPEGRLQFFVQLGALDQAAGLDVRIDNIRFAGSAIDLASVMTDLLRAQGVPRRRILPEETGTDTLSSARAVAALLQQHAATTPVFAASSLYHLPRCLMLLRLMGLPARAAGPPTVPAATVWWRRCYWWLREVPALPYDAALALLMRCRERFDHG